ncbi:2-dehydro-3-deoxygalactonokinase [Brevundimonas bacteroides]|uniref:2-dehydro-3-deoxygalactonokinase n=1 Tax=Brevundimonas bacteroides TaxID=74311 RepID=UPI000495CC14|nr:2-dehydro-3-deoxygalactonokinase [Brevundimonas bacteroides]
MSGADLAYIGVQLGLSQGSALGFAIDGRVLKHTHWIEDLDLARSEPALGSLHARLSQFDKGSVPVLIAGMGVGLFEPAGSWSRGHCPIDPTSLAADLQRASLGRRPVFLSPGLSCISPYGAPDILRGEEIQAFGLAGQIPRATLLSVPGRHGKWLRLREGRIERFHTAMTVELHHLLATYSIVGKGWPEKGRTSSDFLTGLQIGLARSPLTRTAFELRGAVVAGEIDAAQAGDRAWGLLIGADLADLPDEVLSEEIVIAGRPETAELYRAGLEATGAIARIEDPDALAAAGFVRVASAAGLVDAPDAELVR